MTTKRILLGLGLLGGLGLGAVALPGATPATHSLPSTAGAWQVDATHSNVLFKVKHLGASWFYGRFNEVGGTIEVADELEDSSVLIQIQAGSVDAKNDNLNKHLKSPDFFDAAQFPEIVFESTGVKPGREEGTLEVSGNLTLRGVTKPLTVTVEKVGEGQGRGGTQLAGFHTQFTIDRTDFGVSYGADNGALGKEVELTISIEASKK